MCIRAGGRKGGPQVEECGSREPLEEPRRGFPPGLSEAGWPCHLDFGSVKLILEFCLPELCENKFLLF